MGKLLAIATLVLAACQPMYGAKAPPVRNPPPIRHAQVIEPPAPPKQQIEDCNYKGVAITKPPKRDVVRSQDHIQKADVAVGNFDKALVPVTKGDLLIDSIQQYGNALEKDPYSVEATLKLARAYEKAQRKGCALRLLGRLAKLADHPTYQRSASEAIDDVENHKTWFEDYRKDALSALGR
ncbi:hypothetical protein BH11MYX3_BH11MYX3_25290 [soil metagenome]